MATYEITAPDGRKFRVSGPGTKEDALAQVQAQYKPQQPTLADRANPDSMAGLDYQLSRWNTGAPDTVTPRPSVLQRAGSYLADYGRGMGQALSDVDPREIVPGALEAGASVATGMLSPAAAVGATLGQGKSGRDLVDPEQFVYQPRTKTGQALTRFLAAFAKPLSDTGADVALAPLAMEAGSVGRAEIPAPITRRAPKPPVPSIDELKAASQQAYKTAEKGAGVVAQNSIANFTNRAEQVLANESLRPKLHPATMIALEELQEAATRPGVVGSSLKDLDGIRRVLGVAERKAEMGSDDARLAGKLLDEFDDYVDNLSPKDLVGEVGDAHLAAKNYAQARELWARMRKSQDIENLFERAENAAGGYSQSGFDNALRIQFRRLADNKKRFSRFTKDEQAAILKVVRGGPIQNIIRWAGKFAPRGVVSGAATTLLGNLMAGPLGAMALAGAGEGARAGAGALRVGAAENVQNLVRLGPNATQPGVVRPTVSVPGLGYLPPGAAVAPQISAPTNYLYQDQQRKRNSLAP